MARKIDGKAWAAVIQEEAKAEAAAVADKLGRAPALTVIIVGGRPDSAVYVRMKTRACDAAGVTSETVRLPEDVTQEAMIEVVDRLNADSEVDGILCQLPLPDHLDARTILGRISVDKDVDGFHEVNVGHLAMRAGNPRFVPCTPQGCLELLKREGVTIAGKNAVVLGRSDIVGVPMAMLLLKENATVTICHSRTEDIPSVVRGADILVAAVGRTEMVKKDWIKPGAVVIDVGINSVDDASKKAGYRLVGDCDFKGVSEVASAVTPVPGGVGPMTVAMLIKNTVTSAARLAAQIKERPLREPCGQNGTYKLEYERALAEIARLQEESQQVSEPAPEPDEPVSDIHSIAAYQREPFFAYDPRRYPRPHPAYGYARGGSRPAPTWMHPQFLPRGSQ